MWVKLQDVLYNFDYVASVWPVKEGVNDWYITLIFADGSEDYVSYVREEDAKENYEKIEDALRLGNNKRIAR
jgi:hypothetical protein